jgi:hypothetical protein
MALEKDARRFHEHAGMSVMHRYASLCKSLRGSETVLPCF